MDVQEKAVILQLITVFLVPKYCPEPSVNYPQVFFPFNQQLFMRRGYRIGEIGNVVGEGDMEN